MRVDSWFGEQINRMIESFEISLPEQNLAFIANCVLEPSSNNGYSTPVSYTHLTLPTIYSV